MRAIKFRCFYRGIMYPVKEMSFNPDNSFSVSAIEMDLEGLGVRNVSPGSEHIKGIMQFTGLHDVNGNEIYENDILSPTPKREVSGSGLKKKPNNKNKTVIFHEGAFKILSGPDKGRHSLTGLIVRTMGYVVIGNTLENHELLNPTQP